MARIRTIKPEFWASEQVMECSRNARLLFVGLWNFCDDQGRAPWKPRQIKAQVFPGDDDVTVDDVLGWLQELSGNGLIMPYVVDGAEFFAVTGWHHQRIDKPQKPKYPAPVADHSRNDPGALPPDRKGKEGKGEERSSAREPEPASKPEPEAKPEPPAGGCAAPKWDGYSVWELWQDRRQAAGKGTSPQPPGPSSIEVARRWIEAGADRAMVAQAFDAALAKDGEPPRSLKYFDPIIGEALAVKADPLAIPAFMRRGDVAKMDPETIRKTRLATYRSTGYWDAQWGPQPAPEAAQ